MTNRRRCERLLLAAFVLAACGRICVATEPEIATQEQVDRLPREQRITLESIRKIAIAVESFAVANDRYPGPTEGGVDIAFLKKTLVPTYLEPPGWDDGWDRRLRFLSNGKSYVIISYGSDGVPDRKGWDTGEFDAERLGETLCGGSVSGAARDIVFMDGEFCQYPEGL